jgi:hypothetical protein
MHLCPDEINIIGQAINFVAHCWCAICVYAGRFFVR